LVFVKACEAYLLCELKFNAAKCLEEAATCSLKLNKNKEAAEFYERAGIFYRDEDGFGKAATAFSLAAEAMESVDEEKAYEYYKESIEIYKLDDKERQAGDVYRSAYTFLLKTRRIKDVLELINEMIELYIEIERNHDLIKLYLTVIVLDLHLKNVEAANNHFNEYMQNEEFLLSDESTSARNLISAFQQRNEEELEKCKKNKILLYLHNEVAFIVKSLEFGEDKDDGIL